MVRRGRGGVAVFVIGGQRGGAAAAPRCTPCPARACQGHRAAHALTLHPRPCPHALPPHLLIHALPAPAPRSTALAQTSGSASTTPCWSSAARIRWWRCCPTSWATGACATCPSCWPRTRRSPSASCCSSRWCAAAPAGAGTARGCFACSPPARPGSPAEPPVATQLPAAARRPACLACMRPVPARRPNYCLQVRNTPGVYESFRFPTGVRPALAGFLLFQQIIGPVDEVRPAWWLPAAGGWRLGAPPAGRAEGQPGGVLCWCAGRGAGPLATCLPFRRPTRPPPPAARPPRLPAGAGPAVQPRVTHL